MTDSAPTPSPESPARQPTTDEIIEAVANGNYQDGKDGCARRSTDEAEAALRAHFGAAQLAAFVAGCQHAAGATLRNAMLDREAAERRYSPSPVPPAAPAPTRQHFTDAEIAAHFPHRTLTAEEIAAVQGLFALVPVPAAASPSGEGEPETVARFTLGTFGDVTEDSGGAWVQYVDYAALTARLRQSERKAELLSRQADRYVPCADHRDKVTPGECQVCKGERALRQSAQEREALEKALHKAFKLTGLDFKHADAKGVLGRVREILAPIGIAITARKNAARAAARAATPTPASSTDGR